ncbi:hypothetical protein [Rubritalea sp.]|uniref:O-linked N-acetylglucosamine transferase, SPINDLY family protein n=1 Tax=Rubritalea sp. TaxID=2109375 RepID=UPI003EFABCD4
MHFIQALAYIPDVTDEDLKAAGQEWEAKYAKPTPKPPLQPINGRIRIGYYSPDFRNHSISYFLRPILREYDRSQFEVFLYSDSRMPNHVTEELRSYADHWRDLLEESDDKAITRIKEDDLHLLVDLTGYFGEARPWIFATRPAPVQAHLVGYNGTTGLSSLDYRISDAICDPPEHDHLSSEKVFRLEPGFHCFHQEPSLTLKEGSAPCETEKGITFGCFNNAPKLNDEALDTWAVILKSVPESRLLLKITSTEDLGGQELMMSRFTCRGIDPSRIELIARTGHKENHLRSHHLVDIILDPFPISGTTTTLEALWMGVPVLTLHGHRHSARVSSSLLSQIGLTEGITHSTEEYIQRAIEWTNNRAQIACNAPSEITDPLLNPYFYNETHNTFHHLSYAPFHSVSPLRSRRFRR